MGGEVGQQKNNEQLYVTDLQEKRKGPRTGNSSRHSPESSTSRPRNFPAVSNSRCAWSTWPYPYFMSAISMQRAPCSSGLPRSVRETNTSASTGTAGLAPPATAGAGLGSTPTHPPNCSMSIPARPSSVGERPTSSCWCSEVALRAHHSHEGSRRDSAAEKSGHNDGSSRPAPLVSPAACACLPLCACPSIHITGSGQPSACRATRRL